MPIRNRCQSPWKHQAGYTLVELLVATAVLAVLLQLGVPALSRTLSSWQRDAATKAITSHLALARSEAIHWSRRVVMCSSTDGVSCAASAEKEWKSGWLVFHDLNSDGKYGAQDKLVAVAQSVPGITSLKGNALVQRFVFLPTGMMAAGMSTLEVVPRTGAVQRITVNRIGRVRLSLDDPTSSS